MGFRTVCIESRSRLSYASGYLVVRQSDKDTKVHLGEINLLVIATTQAYVSTYLMSELTKHKIPVVFCDDKSFPIGEYLPLYGSYNSAGRVADQMGWTEPAKKRLWKYVVKHKISRQADMLGYCGHDEEEDVLRNYARSVKSGDTDNREAAAAALYFPTMFGKGFRRDQDIPVNASLNYGYSLLLAKVSREIASRGYLTHVGICHRGELNQWNLACDLMEPFRAFVDRTVIDEIGLDDFGGEARHTLLSMFNKTVSVNGGNYKASSAISMYVADCLAALEKRIDPSEIACYSMD